MILAPSDCKKQEPWQSSAWQIQKWMLTAIYWMEHRAPNEAAIYFNFVLEEFKNDNKLTPLLNIPKGI
jgi:hypothetical protein